LKLSTKISQLENEIQVEDKAKLDREIIAMQVNNKFQIRLKEEEGGKVATIQI